MRICIAGSRDFEVNERNFNILEYCVDKVIDKYKQNFIDYKPALEIVSGTANGADTLGEMYAFKHTLDLKKFPADWNSNGKAAGHIRNKIMAEYSDIFILFWDGLSKGTKNMLDNIKKLDKNYYLFNFNGDLVYDYTHDSKKKRNLNEFIRG